MNKSAKVSLAKKKVKYIRPMNSVSVPAEIIISIILGLFSLFCVVPFIFVVIISFTDQQSIREIGFSFWPNKWSLNAYKHMFDLGRQLWVSYFNSFFTTIVGTILSVLMTILYSYALFRTDFKFRRFFSFFCFFTMMFGGGLVPTVMVSKNMLGLDDNYAALIVPLLLNPFNIIIMRTFFQSSVPDSLIEAAAIDGSGEYNTLFKIIIPVAKPGIATVALLTSLAYWNEWFVSLLYIRNPDLIPLQYFLIRMQRNIDFLIKNSAMVGVNATQLLNKIPADAVRMGLVVFIVVPIAFAYPFFQRYIISGLTVGSVKG